MSHELVIRELRSEDVEAVVAIAVEAWRPVYAQFREMLGPELFAAENPDWPAEKARQVRRVCEPTSAGRVLVAELEGEVVGFVSFFAREGPRVGEIGNNAVHPRYQSRGIATQLYARALESLKDAGMRFVKVVTGGDPSHAPARRAYAKAGFTISVPSVTYYRSL